MDYYVSKINASQQKIKTKRPLASWMCVFLVLTSRMCVCTGQREPRALGWTGLGWARLGYFLHT